MNKEIRKLMIKNNLPESIMTLYGLEIERITEEYHKKQLLLHDVSKRLEMRKQASNVFELTKGFTTEPTDNAMKTALEMAHNVMVLTADLDGM